MTAVVVCRCLFFVFDNAGTSKLTKTLWKTPSYMPGLVESEVLHLHLHQTQTTMLRIVHSPRVEEVTTQPTFFNARFVLLLFLSGSRQRCGRRRSTYCQVTQRTTYADVTQQHNNLQSLSTVKTKKVLGRPATTVRNPPILIFPQKNLQVI